MIKKILQYHKEKTTAYKIALALFSLMFLKSIAISPFTLASGLVGVLLGFVLWAAAICAVFSSAYFLSKISWKYKDTKVKKNKILLYMLPSLALSTFLLLVYYPGIMSWDSMYIWEITALHDYSNLHPITYVLFVRVARIIADSPWLVIAIQFTFSAFVFAYTGYAFETFGLNKKMCWALVLVLSLYPINVITNVIMLKDVPYIMSLVLLGAIIMKALVNGKFGIYQMASIAAVSLFAMFSRHNAMASVPITLMFLAVFFIAKKQKKSVIKAVSVLACVLAVFFAANAIIISALGNRYWQRSSSSDILMLPTAQLSYTIDKNWDELSGEEKERAGVFLDLGYIHFQKEKIPNWHFNNRYLETMNLENTLADKKGYIKFYLDTLKKYPLDMIKEYEQLTGIVWAAPNYGYTLVRNVGIPEYHTDINLKSDYKMPRIAKYLDSLPNIYFLLRPALWLMLSILLIFSIEKKRRLMAIAVISPMLANALVYLMGTPAQNVRYLYCNFSCFIMLFAFTFMSVRAIGSKKDKTEGGA